MADPALPGPTERSRKLASALLHEVQDRLSREPATVAVTILFTDLAGFSGWLLEAGDEPAFELLRQVAAVVEPVIAAHHGRIVKRLGGGHMAAFTRPDDGIEAALEMVSGLSALEVGGHQAALCAGLHTGMPQKLGGDYLGTDVNIAARVGAAARPGEVLATRAALDALEPELRDSLKLRRRRGFRAKGTPAGLSVFAVTRVPAS